MRGFGRRRPAHILLPPRRFDNEFAAVRNPLPAGTAGRCCRLRAPPTSASADEGGQGPRGVSSWPIGFCFSVLFRFVWVTVLISRHSVTLLVTSIVRRLRNSSRQTAIVRGASARRPCDDRRNDRRNRIAIAETSCATDGRLCDIFKQLIVLPEPTQNGREPLLVTFCSRS